LKSVAGRIDAGLSVGCGDATLHSVNYVPSRKVTSGNVEVVPLSLNTTYISIVLQYMALEIMCN